MMTGKTVSLVRIGGRSLLEQFQAPHDRTCNPVTLTCSQERGDRQQEQSRTQQLPGVSGEHFSHHHDLSPGSVFMVNFANRPGATGF